MIIHSYMLKNMMRSYDRQLGNGQRLERIKKHLSPLLTQEGDQEDDHGQTKRDQLVQQISREIMDNLLGSGSTNPIVQEIKEELDREFPEKLFFSYGASDKELKILRSTEQGVTVLSPEDRAQVMTRIEEITRDKVSRTLICP
ncbi:DVU0524 family FlgM-associated protein [Desulfoplanes formicivorans]|uniref:Uncharacterized protein n=1 Tax=Desulfoplanes formicivorans TaxID=1592317 RepID=A0A194ALU3_9BACT|nr:DVU0524 family FlgM-associated protein [Desulfoplanes formicivorans]GAU09629.1 hypothetical protein DPF_2359 [Desulfoplanes formicivorans]